MLTNLQRQQYERDGFLVIEGFATPEQCAALRARANEIVAAFDPAEVVSIFSTVEPNKHTNEYFLSSGDQVRCFFEEEAFDERGQLRQAKEQSINKIGHALHELEPVFEEFSFQPRLAELAADLGYITPRVLQSMYIFKQPHIGGEVVCHQDATFLYTEPNSVTGFWFALERATVENGCLRVLPGGHQLGLKKLWLREDDAMRFEILDETPWPEAEQVPLEVEEGTLVILHGMLPHRSYANRSPRSRHAYTLHLVDADCHYPASNWLQRAQPPRVFKKTE